MASQAVDPQPVQPRGLLVIYSILTRLAEQGAVAGEELARQANVTMDYGRPI